MDTVSNNIVDTSYTRFITIEKEIYLTMLWTDYQNASIDTVSNNIVHTSYTRFIITDKRYI